jgi:acetate kinase
MKILVINAGSSSLKYQLFDMLEKQPIGKGIIERIGQRGSKMTVNIPYLDKPEILVPVDNFRQGVSLILKVLTDEKTGSITDVGEIAAVGHRVVHGGDKFAGPVVVDKAVKKAIELLADLAPLHNRSALEGIKAFEKALPGKPQVAVFDTSFHQTIPKKAYLYSIPYRYYRRYGIRKYGFHGSSHKYVAVRAAELLGRDLADLKLITCHLGNGSSVTAIEGGKSIDTSMGFTPLEGLTMGTRSGDLDPSIISFLVEREEMSIEKIKKFLNTECGVLGISGISNDFRDLEKAADKGDKRAKLALEVFVYDVKRYICAYIGILNGIDALVFTAGIGENSPFIRQQICDNLSFMGLEVDSQRNKDVKGREQEISTANSRPILVIPTNEELMIAVETQAVAVSARQSFA